ncbi:MAG: 30S ribosome-binding factor RbfA [Arenimonas sp.]
MKKSFHRTDRVSAQLRRDLGLLVHQAVRNHGLPSMSVSDVEISRDLAHAKVFVTALLPEQATVAVKALKELAPELRYQLGKAVRMRHVPELHFFYDDSVDRGERIDSLLRANAADLRAVDAEVDADADANIGDDDADDGTDGHPAG